MMRTGMLWYDNNPKTTLIEKIELAAQAYQKKYGHPPDVCCVNPGMLSDEIPENGIKVQAYKYILPGHFWIGMNQREGGTP